jgi:chromosome segregation ATPase
MVTRRKPVKSRRGDEAGALRALGKQMVGHFEVFGKELRGLGLQVKDLDQRMTEGFAKVDARFAQVDARFAQVDARFAQIDARFDQIDAHLSEVHDQLGDIRYELGQVKTAVLHHGQLLKKKVDRNEVEGIVEGVLARKSR